MTQDAILTLDGVVAGYGKMTILNGVSAAIHRGAITTVIGPNGAGKSTLFKTVFGLLGVRTCRRAAISSPNCPCVTISSWAVWRSATPRGSPAAWRR
jgi:ABC-type lipopolysaccharide export system ATPase subunit